MVRYQLIKAIRGADRNEIGDVLAAAMERYREVYPDWRIFYYAIENKNRRKYKRELLRIIWMMIKYDLFA